MAKDGHKSIGTRIVKAKTANRRAQIASEWAENWIGKENIQMKNIEEYIRNGDFNPALDELHDLHVDMFNRLYALKNIFRKIAEAPKDDSE